VFWKFEVGYARFNTYGQTLTAQLDQLRGARGTKIFREKVTGACIEPPPRFSRRVRVAVGGYDELLVDLHVPMEEAQRIAIAPS
jgi:hypothetical protein